MRCGWPRTCGLTSWTASPALRAAIAVAREHPARLVRAGAAELLAGLVPVEGTLTVVWHSVMWQYLDAQERRAVTERLE